VIGKKSSFQFANHLFFSYDSLIKTAFVFKLHGASRAFLTSPWRNLAKP